MVTSQFMLCALPGVVWDPGTAENEFGFTLAFLAQEALELERRLYTGAVQDHERKRYELCCSRIEAMTASPRLLTPFATTEQFATTLETLHVPIRVLGPDYLHVLSILLPKAPRSLRLEATFFPPHTLAGHLLSFKELARGCGLLDNASVHQRLAFYKLASEFECGVVELQRTPMM